MSLLSCFYNQITLEIFLDLQGNAEGELYLDDGETMKYADEIK